MADYAKDVLVDTDWVEQHLDDDSIRIVEVDENPALYAEAHIPGAIGFDWKKDLQDQVKRDFLGPGGLRRAVRLARDLRRPHDRPLRRPQQLVRGLHLLVPEVLRPRQRQAGQRPAREVDRRGPPDDDRRPGLRAGDVHRPARRRQRSAPSATRCSARSDNGKRLVDVRSPQEFCGELIAMAGYEQEGAQRGGHIPGAVDPVGAGGQRGRHLQVGRRAARALQRQGRPQRRRADHRLLPHRRALGAHLVRAARAARRGRRQELRRLVDRVGQPRRRADREGRVATPRPRGRAGRPGGLAQARSSGSRSSRSPSIRAVAPQMRCSPTT